MSNYKYQGLTAIIAVFIVSLLIGQGFGNFIQTRSNVATVALATMASGTTYYVSNSSGNDGNSGLTTAAPWKTIDKVNQKIDSGLSAGDSILFKRGDTWTGGSYLEIDNIDASAGSPVTFGAYGTGVRPIFDFMGLNNNDSEIYLASNKNVVMEGLHLTRSNKTKIIIGMKFEPAPENHNYNVTLRDMQIEGLFGGVIYFSHNGILENSFIENNNVGQAVTSAHSGGFYSSEFANVTIRSNKFCGNGTSNVFDHNMYISSLSQNWLIENNEFCNASNFGIVIHGYNVKNITIRNNNFHDNQHGIGVGGGYGGGGQESFENVLIENNIFRNQSGSWIIQFGNVRNYTFRNNLVYNNPDGRIILTAKGDDISSNGAYIYGNTFYNFASFFENHEGDPLSSNVVAMDNIVVCSSGSSCPGAGYSNTGTYKAGNLFLSLSQAGNYFVNPAGGDFHLKSIAVGAIDQGTNLNTLQQYGADISAGFKDYDSLSRPQGAGYDIGAYEYTSTTTNRAPTVSAGIDQTITLPQNQVTLLGSVSDDGLPTGSTLTTSWSKVSGLGTVTFGNLANPTTIATFSQAGTYVLQLAATDSALTTTDQVTITVNPVTVTCTSFTYSAWTPAICPANGIQTRSVLTSSPADCIGGTPVLFQTCTPVPTAPQITTQPVSQTVGVGSAVTFSVGASGTTPLNYQWKKGTTNVGTNSSTYTISSAQLTDAGNYSVVVSNGILPNATSNPATLAVTNSFTIGETNVLSSDDSNSDQTYLLTQSATLTQAGTLQSLSLYVSASSAGGHIRLGLYDDAGGAPGQKRAETAELPSPVITSGNPGIWVSGAVSPILLAPGTYWLALLYSNPDLQYRLGSGGTIKYHPQVYGSLPPTFGSSYSTAPPSHWSFFATLTPTPALTSAASTMTHGTTTYNLLLNTTGQRVIEPRYGNINKQPLKLVFTFGSQVTANDLQVTTTPALTAAYQGNTLMLTGSNIDKTCYQVSLKQANGNPLPSAPNSFYLETFRGDQNQNGTVDQTDMNNVRGQINSIITVNPQNFLADLNADGKFNTTDFLLVRGNLNKVAPACGSTAYAPGPNLASPVGVTPSWWQRLWNWVRGR